MPSYKVDTSKPVLVTGATGYVAGVLVKELLSQGVTVHAAVRDPSKKERIQHLIDIADASPGNIKFFQGDLLTQGSYEEGMKGCSIVFHTASPFAVSVEDPQRDLVTPAVEGTRNVLTSATKTPSVKRVVLTSSVVAIYCDATDSKKAPNGVLNEDIWNFGSSLEYQPYSYSKTLAEITAWQIAGSQTQWDMVVMNPGLVMGPGTKYHATSESYGLIKDLATTMSSGCPDMDLGVVDVRDVARAHVAGAYLKSAKGRHVLVGTNTSLFQLAESLRPKYSDYPIAPRIIPKTLVWLLAPYIGQSRHFISNNIGASINLDNTKAKEELGIEFTPIATTMQDMFQHAIDEGTVSKK